MGMYGKSMALFYALENHYNLLLYNPDLLIALIKCGCVIPRFIAQKCEISKHKTIAEFIVLEYALGLYDHNSLKLDDIKLFEYYANNLQQHFKSMKELLRDYYFFPIPEVTPSAVFTLYKIMMRDITLFDWLIDVQHLNTKKINDHLIKIVLSNAVPKKTNLILQHLLKKGYRF